MQIMLDDIKPTASYTSIKRHVYSLMVFVFLFISVVQSHAASVQVNASGYVTGISNLTVGTEAYDIDFMYGSFDELFMGSLFSDAPGISEAIRDVLNTLSPVPQEVYDPDAIAAPAFLNPANAFSIPYTNLTTISLDVAFSGYSFGSSIWLIGANSGISNLGVASSTMYAVPSLSNVPLPAAFWLFGSGLVGLIGITRRKKA